MAREEGSWTELAVGVAAGVVLGGIALAGVFWVIGAVVSFVSWMLRIAIVLIVVFFVLSLFLRGRDRSGST